MNRNIPGVTRVIEYSKQMCSVIIGLIPMAAGLWLICGAVFNWNIFMEHYRSAFLIEMIGRTGARIVWILIGALYVALGIRIMIQ